MMIIENLEFYLVLAAFLMLVSVLSSKISDKFGIPTLFIFLGLGMLAGSDGILGIHFDNPNLAQSIGTIALIFILLAEELIRRGKRLNQSLKKDCFSNHRRIFNSDFNGDVCVLCV